MSQSHDIEDVLSSIRRLVAQDDAARPARSGSSKAPTEGSALLLGEASRVSDPEDPFQAISRDGEEISPADDASPSPRVRGDDAETPGMPQEIMFDPPSAGPDLEGYAEDADYEVAFASSQRPRDASSAPRSERDVADLLKDEPAEDALRDLIAEIVRRELSGELGERITRNVRKLVRREIRQMLASDEFE